MASIEVKRLRIPLERVRRLSDEQRYSYYVMGHAFNELICLQKLVAYALPKHDDRRNFRFTPELAQAFFFFRIASAKVWEATLLLRSATVSSVLLRDVFPHWEAGKPSLRRLNRSIEEATWLSAVRNRSAFHYPSLEDWRAYVTPLPNWVDDDVFLGEESGNVFYDASEAVGRHWLFSLWDEKPQEVTIHRMIDDMINLLKSTTTFLEEALGTFIFENLLPPEAEPTPAGHVLGPDFGKFALPFWTDMKPHKRRNAHREEARR